MSFPPPARARGTSRAAAAAETLVLQRLLLDKAPDSRARGRSLPGKPAAEASSRGWRSSAPKAVSWSLSVPWGGPEVERIQRMPPVSPPTRPRLAAQERASLIN